jgi:excisionase family DNA binding protein
MHLSPKEFADRMGKSIDTIYRWINKGLPHYRVGGGNIMINEIEAFEWMRKK